MSVDKNFYDTIQDKIDTTDEARHTYKRDASIFEVLPSGIAYPQDTAELQRLVVHISKRRQTDPAVSLTARNGGTCMSGGSLTKGYIVDMSRHFNHIEPVDLEGRSVWVQGGVMHKALEEATHPHGLYFAPYTSSHDICGVGGMLGNNASGEKSVKYGPTSANVGRIKVVLSDGEQYEFGPLSASEVAKKRQLPTFEGHLYREVTQLIDSNWNLIDHQHPHDIKKNAAGYPLWDLWDEQRSYFNMARLFIGSQGTLGIITDAELKLVPFANASRMIVAPIDNLHELMPVVKTMLRFYPETCETFDHNTYDLAKQYHPEDAARTAIADGKHMVVMAVYAGDSQEQADQQAGQAKEALERLGHSVSWIDDPDTVESFLVIRRKSFRMLLEHPRPDQRALAFLEDTIVPLEHYGEFLLSLESIIGDYGMIYTYAGHIGDGSIRLIPLANVEAEGAQERIMQLAKRVNDLVFAFSGSMSADHNDGIIRTPFLEDMYGKEMNQLFKEVKQLFDPLNIFNPGKKVGGTYEFAREHIVRTNQTS